MRIKDYDCKFFSSNKTLSIFLSDVRKYSVPTPEEKNEMVKRYKAGDNSAYQEIVCRNLRFIYALAKIYAKNEEEVLDYVNEGVTGIREALDKFNPELGNDVTTYIVWYIRRAMNHYLNDTNNMVNRSNSGKIGSKIDKIRQKYCAENGREPSVEEIKDIIKKTYDIDVKDNSDLYDVNVASIDAEVDDDYTVENASEFNDKTASLNTYEITVENDYKKQLVLRILSIIPPKTADILKMLFGCCEYDGREYTPEEVAEKMGIRVSEVVKRRDKAIKYLQQNRSSLKGAI